jgi:hypothetical protein
MNIYNKQLAFMGTFSGETPKDLLQNIRDSEYDLSDCFGSNDDYIYDNDAIFSNASEIDIVAE